MSKCRESTLDIETIGNSAIEAWTLYGEKGLKKIYESLNNNEKKELEDCLHFDLGINDSKITYKEKNAYTRFKTYILKKNMAASVKYNWTYFYGLQTKKEAFVDGKPTQDFLEWLKVNKKKHFYYDSGTGKVMEW
jgi:hypothetical protein